MRMSDDLYLATCAHEQKIRGLAAVGMVNGRGYDGRQIDAICEAHGPCFKQFEAYLSQFFTDFDLYSLCLRFSQMPRCPVLAILVTTTDIQNQLLYPMCMYVGY